MFQLSRASHEDFIMDETSILQYSRYETTGDVFSNKLISLDFLPEKDFYGEEHAVPTTIDPGVSISCLNCGKIGQDLKRCSRCRHVNYCSTKCQRADWIQHKIACHP